MSDETPQKGWDSWFSAEPDSQGGEPGTPEQEAETQLAAVPPAPPETPAEQTNWTVPSLGAVLEGGDAQATQVVQPAPPDGGAAGSGRRVGYGRGEGTKPAQAQPPAQSQPSAQAEKPVRAEVPADQAATQYVGHQQPAQQPTAVVPPVAAPLPPPVPASAPSWQVPQPAQMWSAAPSAQAQGSAAPGNAAPTHAQDEWAGWDDEPERRRSSPAPVAGGGDGGYPHGGNGDAGSGGPGGGRSGSRKKLAAASGVGVAGIIALVTVLVLNQGGSGGGGTASKPSGFQPTASTVAGDAQETAAAFLAAWQSGNFQAAANYTDDASAALSTLTAYRDGLNLAGLQLTAQNAAAVPSASAAGVVGATASTSASSTGSPSPVTKAGTVTFAVAAKVGLPAADAASSSSASSSSTANASGSAGSGAASNVTGNWSYSSKLTAYEKNGGWWIKWDPALVAPNLTAGEKIVSVAIPPTASEVTDASGNDLANATDPGVHNIAAALKSSAPVGQGTPGVQIELQGADGKAVPKTTDVLVQPVATGPVKTTINPRVEAAAQAAVQKYKDSSMVVIRPSTGEILAVANNDGGNDFALTARVAPGSTNKIITATALLANNFVSSPSQAVECPKSITVNGTVFANSGGESEPANTPFLKDFAVSCNNAFGQWYSKIGSTTLAQTAQKYYGLNEKWNLGLGDAGPYYQIPSSASNGELFQELFGQGQLETAPIAMASVAATVDTGSFKQPIVVAGAAQKSATPLPASVQQSLYQMMKAVTTESDGTAYNVYAGVNSTVYGKTGTADVGVGGTAQANPNGWMAVFDPTLDLAIGCVVLDAGYGASYAGPETAAVLKALQ